MGRGVSLSITPTDEIFELNVPFGKIGITARADNYEDLVDVIVFTSGDVKQKEMVAAASSGPSIVHVRSVDKAQVPIENVHITIEMHPRRNHFNVDAPTGM